MRTMLSLLLLLLLLLLSSEPATATAAQRKEEKGKRHHEHAVAAVEADSLREEEGGKDGVSIAVNATVVEDGEVVLVTINSTRPRNAQHWVAAYSPADVDVTSTVPVKYAMLHDVAPEYEATGTASVRFKLISLRAESYVFKLFEEDWQEGDGKHWSWRTDRHLRGAVAVATSGEVRFSDAMAPSKVRVLPVSPDGSGSPLVRVMWSSGRRNGGAAAAPTLAWGRISGGPYPNLVSASTSYVSREDLCDGPAATIGFRDLGLIHDAVLIGAEHGETVYYTVGDEAARSPGEYELKMPPAPGAPAALAVFADMGHAIEDDAMSWENYGAPSKYTMEQVNRLVDENAIDGVFHVGDISYAEGFLSVWDEYLSQIEPFASRRPYMLNLGNHEQDSPLDTFKKGQAVTIFNVRRHRASPFPPFAHPYPPLHMPQNVPMGPPVEPPIATPV